MSYIITKSVKSRGIAVLLVFFFGPLGLFYSTAFGAVIMSFVVGPLIIWAALASSGLALILLPLYVIAYIVWAVESVNSYNRRIKHEAAIYNKQMYNPQPSESTSKPLMDKESQKWEKRQELQKLEELSKSNNIDEHEYRNKKENIEKEILALNAEPTPLNIYRTEEIYEEPKSNKVIYLLSFLLLATFMYLLYDKDSNSIKFDRITAIFTNKSSKEKEEIKVQLEKACLSLTSGEYSSEKNFANKDEFPFYNLSDNTLKFISLAGIVGINGRLKLEPSHIEVYELDNTMHMAKVKFTSIVINFNDTTFSQSNVNAKKIEGVWKFDAENFFQQNKLKKINSNVEGMINSISKDNTDRNQDIRSTTSSSSNNLIGKNINLPSKRYYSIFYINTQKDNFFDEFLIIGDTLYCNRDIYENEPGEAIDKRVIKKVYTIKDFRYGFLDGTNQKLRNNKHFSLYDISGTNKLADVSIDGTSRDDRNERIYEWNISWIGKKEEIFKTSLYALEVSSTQQENDKVF